ncbi:MAG: hypothetical protein HFE49_03240 [Clostridia bacterium]|nr:hypothetical protein [Clostridia bacterium]
MSMYGVFMNDRFAVIAADTRKSDEKNGETIILQDDYQKLHLFGDLAVAFGGCAVAVRLVLELFKRENEQNIETLYNICQDIIKPARKPLAEYLKAPQEYLLEIIAIQYDKELQKNVMYVISSTDNFQFQKTIYDDGPNSNNYSWGGYEPEKYSNTFAEYCKKNKPNNITTAFLHNFQAHVNKRVGGFMDIIAFDKGELVEYDRFKLQDTYLSSFVENSMPEEGHAIFAGKVSGGSVESDTDINVTKDVTVGRKIILQDKNENTLGYEMAASISVDTGTLYINTNNSRAIELSTNGTIFLNAGAGGSGVISMTSTENNGRPDITVNNKRILVKDDYDALMDKINIIQDKIELIQSQIKNT